MSSPVSAALTTVTNQIAIFLGIPILIAGLIGGILNVIVFLSLTTFRQSSCAFFLTIMSFVNIGQLLTGLLSRIMISGFNLNWTETSLPYCKFRYYCLQVCALTSHTCMCLATIDQFFATSLRPRWQQFFNIKRAHSLCVLFFSIWLLHGIPTLILYSPTVSSRTGSVSCAITNTIFHQYNNYCYTLILAGILPILITVLFGSLAYRNVRQIPYRAVPLVRRELDKQLTSMVLVQVVHNFLVIVPYMSELTLTYTTNFTTQSSDYTAFVYSALIIGLIYYLYFAVSVKQRERLHFDVLFI
jgi:hypothetical protein